jgi:hypothetical protein
MANTNILQQKLVSLAEAIRGKTGKTGYLSLDDMFTEINNIPIGIKAEISYGNTLKNKLESIASAVRAKTGYTALLTLDGMIEKIENLKLTGTVTPASGFDIGTHNIVTRQGNLVTVDVQLVPKVAVEEGMLLFTLPNGWKPKTPITFIAIYPNLLDWEGVMTLDLPCYLNSEGQASATATVSFLSPAKTLLCKFEFEAI